MDHLMGKGSRSAELDLEPHIPKILRPQDTHRTPSHELISPHFHTPVFNVLRQLGKHELAIVRGG